MNVIWTDICNSSNFGREVLIAEMTTIQIFVGSVPQSALSLAEGKSREQTKAERLVETRSENNTYWVIKPHKQARKSFNIWRSGTDT